MLTFGSLFAGIGGIDLGLERAGMRCAWQVEIDDYATRVLTKHWPDVPKFRDVRSVGAHDLPAVDLIAGGFPCQDISNAGKRAGIGGERSGLWGEFARVIRELRPRYVLVENVAALLYPIRRGKRIVEPAPIGRVLGELAALGYDAEWHCIPAAALGAPHQRDRVFIVAYARIGWRQGHELCTGRAQPGRDGAAMADTDPERWDGRAGQFGPHGRLEFTHSSQNVSDVNRTEWRAQTQGRDVFNRNDAGRQKATDRLSTFRATVGWGQWAIEPAVGRMAHGLPHRIHRLRGLGNAVVPQVAEFVGRLILDHAVANPVPAYSPG